MMGGSFMPSEDMFDDRDRLIEKLCRRVAAQQKEIAAAKKLLQKASEHLTGNGGLWVQMEIARFTTKRRQK